MSLAPFDRLEVFVSGKSGGFAVTYEPCHRGKQRYMEELVSEDLQMGH